MTDVATALRVRTPTLSEVVNDLVRKRWVTKCRSVTDTRVVHLRLSRRGEAFAQRIEGRGSTSEYADQIQDCGEAEVTSPIWKSFTTSNARGDEESRMVIT